MQTASAVPGRITVKGRDFAILPPTPDDLTKIHERMRELALPSCTSPLLVVNAVAKDLDPGVLAVMAQAAVARASGGGSEPTEDAIRRQYRTIEGVRFQLWYFANKGGASLSMKDVEAMVGEEERYAVDDALFTACGLGKLPGPKDSAPGESS